MLHSWVVTYSYKVLSPIILPLGVRYIVSNLYPVFNIKIGYDIKDTNPLPSICTDNWQHMEYKTSASGPSARPCTHSQRKDKHVSIMVLILDGNVCPRSFDPIYIVTYYIKWVKTSWPESNSEIGAQGAQRRYIIYLLRGKEWIISVI